MARIAEAAARAGREPAEIELVAVSKTKPPAMIAELAEAGQSVFGENRVQELETKAAILPATLRWHFIGRLQRNKVRKVLPLAEAIHSVDSTELAQRIDAIATELGLFPRVYLQANIAGEASKSGFSPSALAEALPGLLSLPRLEVLGLMAIPPPRPTAEAARSDFRALRQLRDDLQQKTGAGLPGLSMGMSHDFEAAIAEGATVVRVGSALFGAR